MISNHALFNHWMCGFWAIHVNLLLLILTKSLVMFAIRNDHHVEWLGAYMELETSFYIILFESAQFLIPIRIGKERNGKDPREKKKRSLLWLRCMRRLGGWMVLLWRSFIKKDRNSLTGAADCDCIRIKNHLYVACSLVKTMLLLFYVFKSLKLSTYKSPRWVESDSNQLAFLLLVYTAL